MKNKITFTGKVWLYPGEVGNWHFISLPKNDSVAIKTRLGSRVGGWGSVRVEVETGKSRWKTSIFPDKKQGTYILPIKASVRKRENISAGDTAAINLSIILSIFKG